MMIFFGAVLLIYIANRLFGLSELFREGGLARLRESARDDLARSFAIYTLAAVVGCVVLALPGATFAIFAGALFGPILGIIACSLAATIGAMLSFLVGRYFLKDAIRPLLEKNRSLKKLLFSNDRKSETIILMITRSVPLFPYNLQNFAYGITDISFARYSILTFVFMLPGVSLFTVGAAGLTSDEGRLGYLAAAVILAGVVALIAIRAKKICQKDDGER